VTLSITAFQASIWEKLSVSVYDKIAIEDLKKRQCGKVYTNFHLTNVLGVKFLAYSGEMLKEGPLTSFALGYVAHITATWLNTSHIRSVVEYLIPKDNIIVLV